MLQLTRRDILVGSVCAFGAAMLPKVAPGASIGPRAVLFFDDDGLAAGARDLLEAEGHSITAIDLRAHDVSIAKRVGSAAGYVFASADARRARKLVEALGAAGTIRLTLFGQRSTTVSCHWGFAIVREAPPIVRKWVRLPRPAKPGGAVGSLARLA